MERRGLEVRDLDRCSFVRDQFKLKAMICLATMKVVSLFVLSKEFGWF